MKGFLLGLLIASAAWGAGIYVYLRRQPEVVAPTPAAEEDEPTTGVKKPRRRARRQARAGAGAGEGPSEDSVPEAPERKLTAAELRSMSRGDDLSRPDVVHMDMGSSDNAPELSQDDIDARFRARQDSVLDCIDKARPDPNTYVPGRVTIQFRVQRTGQVRGVRVEAPAILQQGGLYGCIKDVVMGLRFPASSGSQVVTYPFGLS